MNKKDRIGAQLAGAMVYPALFVLLLWAVKLTEVYYSFDFSEYGLVPRHLIGLRGILLAPLIHADFAHLISNSIPLLLLGALLFYVYPKSAKEVWIGIYLVSGLWVWAGGRVAFHFGASGLVYGVASFLFFSGVIRRDKVSMAIAMLVTCFYGSMVWGLFPIVPNMSWESHLYGGVVGGMCAWLYRNKDLKIAEVHSSSLDNAIEADNLPWNQFDGPEGNPLPPPPVEEPPVVIFYTYVPKKEGE